LASAAAAEGPAEVRGADISIRRANGWVADGMAEKRLALRNN
jgi:hypothetical protein